MKTPAQRQAERRARIKATDMAEVRGIFAPPEQHAAIRAQVFRMQVLAARNPLDKTFS